MAAHGNVAIAGRVGGQRVPAGGDVIDAVGVVGEGVAAGGDVVIAGGVVRESGVAARRVEAAGRHVEERVGADRDVAVPVDTFGRTSNPTPTLLWAELSDPNTKPPAAALPLLSK